MGHRRLVLLISSMVATFASQMACALGLGEITLHSSLNQPLNAEIKLLQARDLTEQELLIGLASQEAFSRVGVDKPYFLTDLRFSVDLNAPGGPVVNITTRKPVREPFLNFIVQAQWPSGKLLREYTLLMDLPVFTDQAASPVSGAQSNAVAQQPQPKKQQQAQAPDTQYNPRSSFTPEGGQSARPSGQSSSAASSSATSSAPPALAGTSDYSVQANDTLWEIASQVRPDRAVSIQQTMLAIQRLNPDAFINNNINLLKRGQVLRIPERSEIEEYTKQRAVQEVASQNAAWDGDSRHTPTDIQLQGSDSYASYDREESGVEGRLKLSSPDDASDRYEGRGAGSGSSSSEALENELAVTLEQLDKSKRENSDLRSRVDSLEEQIETMERLVEVSSEEMRALELAAQKNAEEADETDAGVGAVESETPSSLALNDDALSSDSAGSDNQESSTGETGEVGANSEVGDGIAETAAAEATPAPVAAPVVNPTKVVMSTPAPEKGIFDILLDNIIWLVAGVVVLLGALYVVVQRRNAAAVENFDEDFLAQDDYDGVGKQEEDEDFLTSLDSDGDFTEEEENYDAGAQEEEFDDAPAEPETGDVVAEADIYIAYGKYDQAEEMLVKALDREPGNADMRLKLLEVYANQQDVARFDPHYAKLRAVGAAEALNRAAQLRGGISGAGEFDPDLYDTSDVEAVAASPAPREDTYTASKAPHEESFGDDDLSFDLNLGDDESAADSYKDSASAFNDSLDDSFDLDLGDLETDLASTGTSSASSDDDLGLDSSLDFDLSSIEDAGADSSMDEFDLDMDFNTGSTSGSGSDMIEDDIEQDVDAIDFDLSTRDDTSEEVTEADDSPMAFDLDDDFDLELSAEDSMDELSTVPDLDLGDSDDISLVDDSLLESAGPHDKTLITKAIDAETLGDNLDLTETTDDSADDLDIDSELDLSALDEELDAMASDLASDDDLAALDLDEFGESDTATNDTTAKVKSSGKMAEPVTDFDDFDDDLDSDFAEQSAKVAEVESMGEETMFDQAISEVPDADMDFELPDIDPESDDEGDLGFLSDSDETATKLDLARAYIDMGDSEGAKDIIDEIIKEGNMQQQQEAKGLLNRLNA